jgi:hypothetical protein
MTVELFKPRIMEALVETLRRRIRDSRPLKVDIENPEGLVLRSQDVLSSISMTDDLCVERCPEANWRAVARMHDIFLEAFRQVLSDQKRPDGNLLTMTFSAVSACRFIDQLRVQMDVPGPSLVDDGKIPAVCAREFSTCVRVMDRFRHVPGTTTNQFMRVLWGDIVGSGVHGARTRKSLLFRPQDKGICVTWLTKDGEVIDSECLEHLVAEAVDAILPELVIEINQLEQCTASWQGISTRLLECVDPRIVEGIRAALGDKTCVHLPLFTASLRGQVPVEVCLLVQPDLHGLEYGRCMLAVNRAHQEFVLEAINGSLYYFPPIQLSARFAFTDGGPRILKPVVRQPSGGCFWLHPYTGDLTDDPFCSDFGTAGPGAAMYEPSAWARQTFPSLQLRGSRATMRDLCLTGQEYTLAELQGRLINVMASPFPGDLLAVVRDIHALLRHGLCRAHQQNRSKPRIHMALGAMPYPVPPGITVPARVFPYDPRSLRQAAPEAGDAGPDDPIMSMMEEFFEMITARRSANRLPSSTGPGAIF